MKEDLLPSLSLRLLRKKNSHVPARRKKKRNLSQLGKSVWRKLPYLKTKLRRTTMTQ